MDGRTFTRSSAAVVAPLLAQIVDFAGTFPPAGLSLEAAALEFVRHRAGPQRQLLARMAVAAGDLERLATWCRERRETLPLPVTAICGEHWATAAATARRVGPAVAVEALEGRVVSVAGLDELLAFEQFECVVEVSCDAPEQWPQILDALAERAEHQRLRAKLRTGGVVPNAIPAPELVARFLVACAKRRLPCKLTAGLHHALSCERALTYAPDSPRGPMFGFVNAYVAAALAHLRAASVEHVAACLTDESAANFCVTPAGLTWRDQTFTSEELGALRLWIGAFGSCSFDEPVEDLLALGWLRLQPT